MNNTKNLSKKAPLSLELIIAVSILWLSKQLFKVVCILLLIAYHITKIISIAAFTQLKQWTLHLKAYVQSEKFECQQVKVATRLKKITISKFKKSKKVKQPSDKRAFLLELFQDEKTPTEIDKLLVKRGEHPYMTLVK